MEVTFHNAVMHPKEEDRKANNVDPDQTAPLEWSDVDMHCLLRLICPNISNKYGSIYKPILAFFFFPLNAKHP